MSDDIQAKIIDAWNSMDESWESYGKIFEDKAKMNAGKVAVMTEHEQITYDQLDERVNRVGNALEAMGIQQNDKVCLMLPNVPEFLYAWWGNAKLGGVTVPLNTALKGVHSATFSPTAKKSCRGCANWSTVVTSTIAKS